MTVDVKTLLQSTLIAGYDGSQGIIGYTGSVGYDGSQGTIGYTGSQGTTGYAGSVGYDGSQGTIGYTGSSGDLGYTGSQGTTGYSGSVGYDGSSGDLGYTGSQGIIGYTGSVGYDGSSGDLGYTGSQGTTGYTGSVGYDGSQGIIGYTGSTSNVTITDNLTDNSERFVTYTTVSTGVLDTIYTSSSKLTYNPSTGTVTTSGIIVTNGDIIVGNAQLATTATSDFLWINSSNGTPTGSITRPHAGAVALHYDTSTELLYRNIGGTDWKPISNNTLSGAILNDGYTEEVFAVTGTTPALSPTNGSIQTWTLTASSTPTAGTWNDGQSITLMIDDGTDYTITWTSLSITWKTDGGTAPTLNTTGYTVIALWKVGSVIYGARVGDA